MKLVLPTFKIRNITPSLRFSFFFFFWAHPELGLRAVHQALCGLVSFVCVTFKKLVGSASRFLDYVILKSRAF